MAITIDGKAVPASIWNSGNPLPVPYSALTKNGLGVPTTTGTGELVWTFSSMEKTNFAWIVTTLMAGANFLSCAAVLPDDLDNEISYSSVIVNRPTYRGRRNGLYTEVEWRFDTMVKA